MSVLHIDIYNNGVISTRGYGSLYDNFYIWQRGLISAKDVNLAWPLHFFVLNSSKEYKELFANYKKYINFVNKDYEY